MLEDHWLIWRLRRGSPEAFSRIYLKHKNELLALALNLARDRGRAEDALHDAFVGLARMAPRLNPGMNLRAYLATAVVNRVRNQYRRAAREELVADPPDQNSSEQDTPEHLTILADDLRQLEKALAGLPRSQSEVITLHSLHGLRFREIAVSLGLSINTVQSRYRYGLEKLRATLTKVMDHEIARSH